MGVEHIDFYGVNRATDLPLVSVSVPTRLFFYAAPLLTGAVYRYFHIYLIKLWDTLADADARVDGKPLGDAVAPWLVIDAALAIRSLGAGGDSVPSRTMQWPAFLLNVLLAWAFGLLVLGLLWWQSMTARDPLMTGIATLSLLVSIWAGAASFLLMIRHMRFHTRHPAFWLHSGLSVMTAASGTAVIGVIVIERSAGVFDLHDPVRKAELRFYN